VGETVVGETVVGQSSVGQDFRKRLTVIVAVGALLRVVRLVVSKWNLALQLNDSLYYSLQARQLAHGVWYRELFVDQPGAEHGPLTSTLMAVVSWGDNPVNRQRIITVACGTATIAIIGIVARRVARHRPDRNRVGLVAAAVAALYPNLWINDGLVMSESVSCLMISLTVWALLVWADKPAVRNAALVGLTAGLGTLARSEVALFVAATAVVMLMVARRSRIRPWPHVATAVGVAFVVVLPWLIFNFVRFDRPVLLTTNEGPALLGSNCDDTYYGPAQGGWSLFCVLNDPGTGPDEDPSTRSARQRHEALSYVRHHLGRLPNVELKRIARSLDLFALDNMVHGDVGEERERWASWACILSFWVLAPLAAYGATLTRRRDRAVLLIPVAIALVATVLIYGGHRIRSAAEPSIVIFAAVAINRLIAWRTPSAPDSAESVA
jgi:hypothetical protein